MNQIAVIEKPASSALVTIEASDLPTILTTPGGLDKLIERIKTDAWARAAALDISTEKGRKAIASLAKTYVSGAKVLIEDAANKLTEDWRNQTAAVVADRKRASAELDALRDEVRKPLTDWQNADAARIAAHEAAIVEIVELANFEGFTADQISERLWSVPAPDQRNWQEFKVRAEKAITGALDRLREAHAAAVAREEAEALLERQRAEEANRQRLAAHETALAEIVELARFDVDDDLVTSPHIHGRIVGLQRLPARDWEELADRATAVRQATADRLTKLLAAAEDRETAERVEREARIATEAAAEARERADQADRDRITAQEEAARLAREAESARVKGHQDAIDTLNDASNVIPGSSSATIRATLQAFLNRPARDWQEFAEEAAELMVEGEKHLRGCLAFAEKREADEAEAQRRTALLGTIGWLKAPPPVNPDWEIAHQVSHIDSTLVRLSEIIAEHEWPEDLKAEAIAARNATVARLTEDRAKLVQRQAEIDEQNRRRVAEAATAAEQKRAAGQKAEEERLAGIRTNNLAHRRRVDRDALAGLLALPIALTEDQGRAIVEAIAKGQVPGITVNYGSVP
jgi:colicin import membrane protein